MAKNSKIFIVEARFYSEIADELAKGAINIIKESGMDFERITVPGVFEIPAAINFVINAMKKKSTKKNFEGFIALGAVIRGETDHYDHICREASRSLMDISVQHSVPLGFGILTCENKEQANIRADILRGNKGADAAIACLRMMELKKELHQEE